MEKITQCQHNKRRKNGRYNFCQLCGSIVIGSAVGLKPLRYYYSIEQCPIIMFEKMITTYKPIKHKINSHYLFKREELIRNIRVIFNKLKFRNQTFYLSILFMDLILTSTHDNKMELISYACLILAAKFDENDPCIPNFTYFENLYYKNLFSKEDLRQYEYVCLRYLDYNLNHNTAYHYICFFMCHGYVFSDELKVNREGNKILHDNDFDKRIEKICNTSKEILFYFIQDQQSLHFSQLHIACSCISLSREILKFRDPWSPYIANVFNIRLEEFQTCLNIIHNVTQKRSVPNSTIHSYLTSKRATCHESTPTSSSTLSYRTSANKNQNSFDQNDTFKHSSCYSYDKETQLSMSNTKNNNSINSSCNRSAKRKSVLITKNEKFLEKIKEETSNLNKNCKSEKSQKVKTVCSKKVNNLIEMLELKIQNKDIKKRGMNNSNVGMKSNDYSQTSVEKKDFIWKKTKLISKNNKASKTSFFETSTNTSKLMYNHNVSKNYLHQNSNRQNHTSVLVLSNTRKDSIKMKNYLSNNEKTVQLDQRRKSIIVPEIKNNINDLKKLRYNSVKKKDIDKSLTKNIGNILRKVNNKSENGLDIKNLYRTRQKSQQK